MSRRPPEPATRATTEPGGADWWRGELVTAQDLCDQRFPDVRYVVPGLFPEGVTLLASRPKLGKSWLLLQIGSAVATGTITLTTGDIPALRGDVLYLALEDNQRRLQRRLTKYFGLRRENWPDRLNVVTKWKRLDQGGLQAIREWCGSVERPALVMIDTLKKIRTPKRNGQTDYDADYEACQGLQELASAFGIAIIVAHHDRKMDADDVFDTVSGTLGLTGGVDTVAILKRRPQGITLHIEGRDLVETVEKAITFDRETCRWTILGEAAEVQRSRERERVLSALKGAADGLTVSEIVARASLVSRGAADKVLGRMHNAGDIERLKRGVYGLPGTASSVQREIREKVRSGLTPLKNQEDTPQSPDLPDLPGDGCRKIRSGAKSPAVGLPWGNPTVVEIPHIADGRALLADAKYPDLPDFLDRRGGRPNPTALGPEGDSLDDLR